MGSDGSWTSGGMEGVYLGFGLRRVGPGTIRVEI